MKTHDCLKSEERILDLLTGEITGEDKEMMRAEMRGCAACSALMNEMELVWNAAGEAAVQVPTLPGEALAAMARKARGGIFRGGMGRTILAGLAAAAVLMAAFVFMKDVPVTLTEPSGPGEPWRVATESPLPLPDSSASFGGRIAGIFKRLFEGDPAPRRFLAEKDEAVEWPDGTRLLLAQGSSLVVRSLDRIELTGTAFMKAKGREASRPLHVTANGVEYTVTGTEVAFFPEHMSVYEGRVKVPAKNLSVLTGRRALAIGPTGEEVRIEPIPPSTAELDWMDGFDAVKRPPLISTRDGGMVIKREEVRVAVDGPVVMTQIHFTFRNTTARRIEGRMKFPLPADASISRLALKIGDRWMEGEFVEKRKARETFEEIVRKMQDPALLEQQEGNIFELRIFPFDPNGDREVILSYTQTLSGTEGYRYRLPLPVGESIGEFDLVATLPGEHGAPADANLGARKKTREEVRVEKKDYTPDRDFSLRIPVEANVLSAGGGFVVARGSVPVDSAPVSEKPEKWLIIADVSASMTEHADLMRRAESEIIERLPRSGSARVAFLREGIIEDYGSFGSLDADRKSLNSHASRVLSRTPFLGGSNFSSAAGFIEKSGANRVILLTDGVSALGARVDENVFANFKGRIDAVMPSSGGDPAFLERLCRRHGGIMLALNRGEEAETLRLGMLKIVARPRFLSAELRTESGKTVRAYGGEFRPVFSGDEFMLVAKTEARVHEMIFLAEDGSRAGNATFEAREAAKEEALARTWALMRIQALSRRAVEEDMERAVREEIIRLSREWRVVSPFTSLLTLETENDYKRFGIERDALAPVLVVEDGRVAVRGTRSAVVLGGAGVEGMGAKGLAGLRQIDSITIIPLRDNGQGFRPGGEPGVPSNTPLVYNSIGSVGSADYSRQRDEIRVITREFSANEVNLDVSSQLTNDISDFAATDENDGEIRNRIAEERSSSSSSDPKGLGSPFALAPSAPPASSPAPLAPAAEIAPLGDVPVMGKLFRRADRIPGKAQPQPKWYAASSKIVASDTVVPHIPSLEKAVIAEPLDPARREELFRALLASGAAKKAIAALRDWLVYDPDNIGLYIQLVELYETSGDLVQARRAAESVVDRRPGSAEARSFLAGKLDEWKESASAIEEWRRVKEVRPELPSGYLSFARAFALAGRHAEAERAYLDLVRRKFDGRFGDIRRLAEEELAILYLQWKETEKAPADIDERIGYLGKPVGAGLRIILTWETDGTDVDLHVVNPKGEECYFDNRRTSTGGELLEDLTEGYGPEVYTEATPSRGEYIIGVQYFSQRVQRETRGQITIVQYSSPGGIHVITKPFLLKNQNEITKVARVVVM